MQGILRVSVVIAGVFVAPLMAEEQKIVGENVGYMGVGFAVDPDTGQVLVEHVVPRAPADLSGVQAGDLLDTVNGVAVRFESHGDVIDFFWRSTAVGVPVAMSYLRGSEVVRVEVTPSPRPAGVVERNAKSVPCRDGVLFAGKRKATGGPEPK